MEVDRKQILHFSASAVVITVILVAGIVFGGGSNGSRSYPVFPNAIGHLIVAAALFGICHRSASIAWARRGRGMATDFAFQSVMSCSLGLFHVSKIFIPNSQTDGLNVLFLLAASVVTTICCIRTWAVGSRIAEAPGIADIEREYNYYLSLRRMAEQDVVSKRIAEQAIVESTDKIFEMLRNQESVPEVFRDESVHKTQA